MADLLFVTWDGGGNVPPALGIAAELARRGHHTRFLGHASQEETIRGAGHAFTAYAEAEPFVGREPSSLPRMVRLFSDRGMGRDLLAEVGRRRPDVVVVDGLLHGAMEAAARSGVQYVALQHLYVGYARSTWLRSPMGGWARLRGLRPRHHWDAAALQLAATLPDLDPGAGSPGPANLRFAGPVLDVPTRCASFAERAVLVSLSTVDYPGMAKVLQKVVDATEELDARVVVTTGPAVDPAGLELHDRVEVHRFVPHDQLMRDVSLVIGHGGHATSMRALAHGLPLLVIPLTPIIDQPMVGATVAAAGAGRTLSPRSSTARIRSAAAALLEDGPHRQAAASLAARIAAARGAATGASLVEELLAGPVSPPSSTAQEPAPGHPSAPR